MAWAEGRLEPGLWAAHVAACPDCRADLASLVSTSASRRIPYAAAAAVLLALGGLWLWKGREEARIPVAVRKGGVTTPALRESALGPTAVASLSPGSKGTGKEGAFHLEEGLAWVESSGEVVKVTLAGWDGVLEIADGAAAVQARPARMSLWMRESWAGEESWGITVVRGTAKVGDRILEAGETLGRGTPREDFRGWKALPGGVFRDSVRTLLPGETSFVAEILVQKRQSDAEGALLLGTGGELWLGALLPSSGWVRLRVEVSDEKVRVLAGSRECLSCRPEELPRLLYPGRGGAALGLRAWGGNLEIREARWRP